MKPHRHYCRILGCPSLYICTCDQPADDWGPTVCETCRVQPTMAEAERLAKGAA